MSAPAEKSPPVLSAAGLTVRRGGRALLEDASLSLAPLALPLALALPRALTRPPIQELLGHPT